jgi:hypothetical protein
VYAPFVNKFSKRLLFMSAGGGGYPTSIGFSGERQGDGVEGHPSIRERSFKPSTCPVESY